MPRCINKEMSEPVVRYREFRPCEPLRHLVRAIFSFTPPAADDTAARPPVREILFHAGDSFCSPLFADAHASIVFHFPRACRADGVWRAGPAAPRGQVIGPMTMVGRTSLEERTEMLGAFLRAATVPRILRVPATQLADRVCALDDLWGPPALALAASLNDLPESARIALLESVLLRSIAPSTATLDIPGMSTWILRCRGRLSIQCLAESAGVSRQHLTRIFRDTVGVGPKLYCRLARFHTALHHASQGSRVSWADVAAGVGYSDQSHMIAEFRRFSSLTPDALTRGRWFHPFIGLSGRAVPKSEP